MGILPVRTVVVGFFEGHDLEGPENKFPADLHAYRDIRQSKCLLIRRTQRQSGFDPVIL